VIPAEADIRCPAEAIFDLIIDFRGQDRWLAKSSSFRGTSEISSDPVALGTTYREPGPFGVRNGTVTEFERPARITFEQPMTMRLHAGTADVTLRYTLTPGSGSTHSARPWPPSPACLACSPSGPCSRSPRRRPGRPTAGNLGSSTAPY